MRGTRLAVRRLLVHALFHAGRITMHGRTAAVSWVEDPMKGLVAQWLEQERAALEAEPAHAYFASIHLDDLLGGEPGEGDLVALGVDALLLCHETVSRSTHLLPMLAITLMSSSTLDTELPDLDRLESLRDGMVPPELYVFRRNLEYLTGGHEEYRAAYIDVDLARRHDVPSMEAHYTTYRDEISRRNGWDYSRTVWFNIAQCAP